MKSILPILCALFSVSAYAQTTSILFLGNSYIYTADLPGTLYNLALAGGDTIYREQNTPGGYTFQQHSTNATSLSKIASRNWDFVVLQEQSQIPSFPPSQVESQCYPYAQILVDSIKSNYQCTEPIFFMTWGRRDGDQSNCQFYAPLCTFEGMNARLRESYLEMGLDNSATVAPCGAAWQQMKLANATFWNGLYSGDGSHPSAWGTYLNACIFYATIFRQSPVGLNYYSSIGQADAEALQQLAEDIVIDSLSNWYIGHQDINAEFTYELYSDTAYFTQNSNNASDHFWDFGDGTTSELENPIHVFPGQGLYTVSHISVSECDSDTFEVDILFPLSVNDSEFAKMIELTQTTQEIRIVNSSQTTVNASILDMSGRMFDFLNIKAGSTNTLNLPATKGIYIIRISGETGMLVKKVVNP